MEEIKAGEYCRVKNGRMFKVDKDRKMLAVNDFLNVGRRQRYIKTQSEYY